MGACTLSNLKPGYSLIHSLRPSPNGGTPPFKLLKSEDKSGNAMYWKYPQSMPSVHGNWWWPPGATHNDHSELSHFSSSSSLRHPSLRRDGTEVAKGGRQAATAPL